MVIYIGNLATDTTEAQLQEVFAEYGRVSSIHVMHDKVSGRGLGFAFVQMPGKNQGLEAIQALNMTRMHGRTVMLCQTPDRVERRAVQRSVGAAC
jgi:RNA recognition motif-containing protein